MIQQLAMRISRFFAALSVSNQTEVVVVRSSNPHGRL